MSEFLPEFLSFSLPDLAIFSVLVVLGYFTAKNVLGAWVVEQARQIAGRVDYYAKHHDSHRIRDLAEVGARLLPERTDLYPVHGDFIEVSNTYFASRDPQPSRWKTDLRLPEVEAGYNIPRQTDSHSGGTATEKIGNQLADENVVVLGEAGSGKSVVCRSVACDWYRSQGIVFYRYGAQGELDNVDELIEMIEGAVRHDTVLVVVEDAARYECRRIYDIVNRFAGDDRVRFLFDSRTYEWDQFDRNISNVERSRIRSEAFHSIKLSKAGDTEREALIEKITSTRDDVETEAIGAEDIKPPINEQAVGTMVQLVYNVLRGADSDNGGTMLNQDVRTKFNASKPVPAMLPDTCRLTDEEVGPLDQRTFHKVAIGVNVLNAMGRPVREPLLYGLVQEARHEQMTQILTVLNGWMVFDDERQGTYRTFPEPWSLLYLEFVMRDDLSRQLFTECVTEFTAVFTDPAIGERLDADPIIDDDGWLSTLSENRSQLLDGFVIDLFEINSRKPKLDALFDDDGSLSVVPIPDGCSEFVKIQARILRGRALRHRDPGHAAELFEAAYSLADEIESDPSPTEETIDAATRAHLLKLRCHRQLGNIAFHGGDFSTAESYYRECLDEHDQAGSNREQALCRANLGATLQDLSRPIEATAQLSEAKELCEPLPLNAQPTVHVHHHYGTVYEALGEYSEAQYHFELSRDIAYKCRDWNLIAWNENRLGNLNLSRGRFSRAEARLHAAQNRASELGFTELRAWSENDLAALERKRGNYKAARDHLDEAVIFNESIENDQLTAWIQYQRGVIALECGSPDRAREHLRDSLQRARRNDYRRIHAWVRITFARTYFTEQTLDTAETHIQEAVDIAHEIHDRQTAAAAIYRAGQIHLARDNRETSEDLFRDALARFDALGCAYEVARTIDVLSVHFDATTVELYGDCDALDNLPEDELNRLRDALNGRFETTTLPTGHVASSR